MEMLRSAAQRATRASGWCTDVSFFLANGEHPQLLLCAVPCGRAVPNLPVHTQGSYLLIRPVPTCTSTVHTSTVPACLAGVLLLCTVPVQYECRTVRVPVLYSILFTSFHVDHPPTPYELFRGRRELLLCFSPSINATSRLHASSFNKHGKRLHESSLLPTFFWGRARPIALYLQPNQN